MNVHEGYIQGVSDALSGNYLDSKAFSKKDGEYQEAYLRATKDVVRQLEQRYLHEILTKRQRKP